MSSDYIPRLRRELLRAGASKQARFRPATVTRGLRPLAAAAAVALVVLAAVLAWPGIRGEETAVERPDDALRLTYRLAGSGAATEQTVRVMRERLAAAGIDDATASVSASGRLTVTAPAGAQEAVSALAKRGRLAIYDWEGSVLGPRGVPAPADASVTGSPDAGHSAAVTRAEAEARAGGRSAVVRARDSAEGWYALGGEPAIANAGIARARPDVDPILKDPIVALELTAQGQDSFTTLTRRLAHRGSEQAADGVGHEKARQHFAIVLDDRIVAVPYIDFRDVPDGIDGSAGTHIQGGLTPETARRIAALLSAGPLRADLVLESEDAPAG